MNIPEHVKKKIKTNYCEILKDELLSACDIKYEIEARIGRIWSKDLESRMNYGILTPVIFKKLPANYVFVPGVDEWDFKNIQKNYTHLKKEHMVDVFKYLVDGNRVRYVNNKIIYCEKKRKVKCLDIHFPECKYDVRISVMTEEKQIGRISKSKVAFVRHRDRTTYSDRLFNYDFTVVKKDSDVSYELEIEVEDLNYPVNDFIKAFLQINIPKTS